MRSAEMGKGRAERLERREQAAGNKAPFSLFPFSLLPLSLVWSDPDPYDQVRSEWAGQRCKVELHAVLVAQDDPS